MYHQIYLDYGSTSFPKPPGVAEAVCEFMTRQGMNINRGNYEKAYSAEEMVYETRCLISELFHGEGPKQVVFTKNVTESLNIVLKGFLKPGDHVLTSSMEHNAVMRPLNQLAARGVEFTRIPCTNEGKLLTEELEQSLRPNTKAVVMTHASNGTLIKKVMMNTVLYADIKREGVYQVALPGGDTGWIGSSGVIELPPRAETEEVSSRYFVSSVLTFVNSRDIQNGMSIDGASVNGVVYVSAEVNGIQIPRTMEDQAKAGTEIIPQPDAVTGKIMIDQILPGDIIFLSNPKDPSDKNIYEMAVCTDTGTLFMISPARTTVRLRNFSSGDEKLVALLNRLWYYS